MSAKRECYISTLAAAVSCKNKCVIASYVGSFDPTKCKFRLHVWITRARSMVRRNISVICCSIPWCLHWQQQKWAIKSQKKIPPRTTAKNQNGFTRHMEHGTVAETTSYSSMFYADMIDSHSSFGTLQISGIQSYR